MALISVIQNNCYVIEDSTVHIGQSCRQTG